MPETGTRRQAHADRIDFRHFLLATAGMVYLTVLLGVTARATGSGLACNANWPLCDGGLLDLFPATLPSAFEWFHRLVAGLAGLFILGAAWGVWRGYAGDARVRWAVAVGLVLLPVQVILGRQTVLTFVPEVLAAHYWTAMAIYAVFVIAVVVAWKDALGRRHVRRALLAAVVLVPVQTLLGPPVVATYSAPVQAAHYAAILGAFAALLLASIVGWRRDAFGYAVGGATALLPVVVFLGRQRIVNPGSAFVVGHRLATFALFVALAAAAVLAARAYIS